MNIRFHLKKNAATQKADLRMSGLGMSNYSEWVASLGLNKTTWFMIISNMQKNVLLNTANMITNINSLKYKHIMFPPECTCEVLKHKLPAGLLWGK